MMTRCAECGEAATATHLVKLGGIGHWNQKIEVWFEKIECMQGHRYFNEVLEVDSEDSSRP